MSQVVGKFLMLLKNVAATLPPFSQSCNYGATTAGGRDGAQSFTVFQQDWEIFTTAVDRLLPSFKTAVNVTFYRAIHGMLCSRGDYEDLLRLHFNTSDTTPYLTTQIHLGVNITPPENHALFLNKKNAISLHREAACTTGITFYHPAYLSLNLGHYRRLPFQSSAIAFRSDLTGSFIISFIISDAKVR